MKKPAQKKKSKQRKPLKRIALLLLLLVAGFVTLWIITPDSTDVAIIVGTENFELPYIDEDDIIVAHTGFTLSYAEEHEQAYWVAYQLTRENVLGSAKRKDNFRSDPKVPTVSAHPNDYLRSGYDRGHLAPAADFAWSEEVLDETFYMSNMSPQEPSFNRGIWSTLEAIVRNFAYEKGLIYVVTGPVLTDGPYQTIGENEVAVPHHFYKVILALTPDNPSAIGFVLPNAGSKEDIASFVLTVHEVEELTGLDFFVALEDELEEQLESQVDLSAWNFSQLRVTEQMRQEVDSLPPVQESQSVKEVKALLDQVMYTLKREVKALAKPYVPDSLWPAVSKLF